MNESPLVSVIIPVYKTEKYLRDSVNSVISQSYKNIEIILVDDGSPDSCPEICDDFAKKYGNILVLHKENGGAAQARNYGIEKAVGDYLLFLDSDDMLFLDAVERLAGKARETGADIVMPDRYVQADESTGVRMERFHFGDSCLISEPVEFVLDVMLCRGRAGRATSVLYRAPVIKKNGIRFPEGYISEDLVFNLEIMPKINKLEFCRHPTVICLRRHGSVTGSFHEDLDKVFLFVDKKVEGFLEEVKRNNVQGEALRKAFLCRNMIVCVSEIFSRNSPLPGKLRRERAESLLSDDKIRDAFAIETISPYFDSGITVLYFKIMFKLIHYEKIGLACFLAGLAGRMKQADG